MSDQANEINDVAPSSLSHIIGQASVVAQVAVALEAAFADNKKLDDCLLVLKQAKILSPNGANAAGPYYGFSPTSSD